MQEKLIIRRWLIIGILLLIITVSKSQNTAEKIIGSNQGLHIGGYAQVDYNKGINDNVNHGVDENRRYLKERREFSRRES